MLLLLLLCGRHKGKSENNDRDYSLLGLNFDKTRSESLDCCQLSRRDASGLINQNYYIPDDVLFRTPRVCTEFRRVNFADDKV